MQLECASWIWLLCVIASKVGPCSQDKSFAYCWCCSTLLQAHSNSCHPNTSIKAL